MNPGAVTISGAAELSAKLLSMAQVAGPKAGIAGTRAAMVQIGKGIRAAINATDAPSEVKRRGRKSIGSRYGKAKGGRDRGIVQAKVGYAVGKKRGTTLGEHHSRGVGMSVENVHWFVFGVQDFGTTERHHKSGHSTGKMPARKGSGFLAGTVQAGFQSHASLALNAARIKMRDVIQKEARKRRK
jgi:hypothetical protein